MKTQPVRILILILLNTSAFAKQLVPGDKLYLNQNTTMYSEPGYDWKSYLNIIKAKNTDKSTPDRVAWPERSEEVIFIDENAPIVFNEDRQETGSYYYVAYERNISPNETNIVGGYIHSSNLSLSRDTKPVNAANCNQCSSYNINSICQMQLVANINEELNDASHTFKGIDELNKYLYTYRKDCKNKYHEKYLNEYSAYIKSAAETFQLPEAFLACLFLKESRFDDDAISKAGATGIAQIMPNTIETINNIINRINTSPQVIADRKKNIQTYRQEQIESIEANGEIKRDEDLSPQALASYNYSKTVLQNHSLATLYRDYIDNIKKTDEFKKHVKQNGMPWTGNYPTIFNKRRANNPALAIGASAMYIRYLLIGFKKQAGHQPNNLNGDNQAINMLAAASGAYNMGPGNAERLIDFSSTDASKWVEDLSTNPETTKHMESIKNCMEKGNSKGVLKAREKLSDKKVYERPCSN